MQILEGTLEKNCRQDALDIGWISRKMNGLGYNSWPDRVFIPPPKKKTGNRFWVEFKRLGEEPTPAQWRMIRDLRSRGEKVYVVDKQITFRRLLAHENALKRIAR